MVWLASRIRPVKTPFDYVPMIAWAKNAGRYQRSHTSCSSIRLLFLDAGPNDLLAMQPHVSFL